MPLSRLTAHQRIALQRAGFEIGGIVRRTPFGDVKYTTAWGDEFPVRITEGRTRQGVDAVSRADADLAHITGWVIGR